MSRIDAAPSPQTVTSRLASLTGTVVSFSRSGRHFAAIEPDVVVLFDLASSTSTRVKVGDARTLVCFEDQIWIAARDQLVRVDFSDSPSPPGWRLCPTPGC